MNDDFVQMECQECAEECLPLIHKNFPRKYRLARVACFFTRFLPRVNLSAMISYVAIHKHPAMASTLPIGIITVNWRISIDNNGVLPIPFVAHPLSRSTHTTYITTRGNYEYWRKCVKCDNRAKSQLQFSFGDQKKKK